MNIQQFNNFETALLQSVLWQYNEATNLLSLLNQKQGWYNIYQTRFWQNWLTNVFDLLTANLFGLSVWSIILNVPVFIPIEFESDEKPIWGFNAYNPTYPTLLNNTNWNFFGDSHGLGSNFSTRGSDIELTLEEQRFLLRLRYFQITTLGNVSGIVIDGEPVTSNGNVINVYGINWFLNYLCTNNDINYSGTIYALDGFDMTMTYVFTTPDFSINLLDALIDLDIWPRPAGVGTKFITNTGTVWGFGIYNQNFENGNFIDEDF